MKTMFAVGLTGLALLIGGCTTGALQADETTLTTSELQALLTGKTVSYVGGWVTTTFQPDGRYVNRHVGGPDRGTVETGSYSFANDQECNTPDETRFGTTRCGRYVRTAQGYAYVGTTGTGRGSRYVVATIN